MKKFITLIILVCVSQVSCTINDFSRCEYVDADGHRCEAAQKYECGYCAYHKWLLEEQEKNAEWDRFVEALIMTESGGQSNAVGPTNDVGILQITPIYVREVNRILGETRYTLNDRYCPDKSIEMFQIIQGYYNPDKSIEKAIKLHNPGAGDWYSDRIYKQISQNT